LVYSGIDGFSDRRKHCHMGQAERPTCPHCGELLILALPPGGKGQRTFQCFDCDGPDQTVSGPVNIDSGVRWKKPQGIRALRLRAGFKNRLCMNVPRPGLYRLASTSRERESKMLFHQRNNSSVATRTHHSPSKRTELELACSKISTSISCGTDEERGLCVKDNFLIERIR
jgi:hypothetical protein